MAPNGDERAPVVVGVAEAVRRPAELDPAELTDTATMMAEAASAAAEDAGGAEALASGLDLIAAAPSLSWPDGDPGRRVGELLGVDAPRARSSMQGGNGPQLLVNEVARRVAAGECESALVCGAEALQTVVHASRDAVDLGWPAPDPDADGAEALDSDREPATEAEARAGMLAPIVNYPIIENAIRAASGRTVAEQSGVIGELWASFNRVARESPAAWAPEPREAEEIATPSESNRAVAFPYTKLTCANLQVDQAAALIICSAGKAAALGIPRDHWVFCHAGADAVDEWFVSHRRELHRSPAIRACGEALFEHTAASADDLGPVDLYSCFPSAVQLAANELGLPLNDPDRPLTQTGGLTFFGGPGNNYATHGIAAVVRALREAEPGTLGLASALGWYATKHAIGIYGNVPPGAPFAALSPQEQVDAVEPREVAEGYEGEATAETCTVVYERDGSPGRGILLALTEEGRRALGSTTRAETMAQMTGDDFLGSRVKMRADGGFEIP